MNDEALLIIPIMRENWFRKILFIFNLTVIYHAATKCNEGRAVYGLNYQKCHVNNYVEVR